MDIKNLSPDDAVLWQWGFVSLNYTIVYTWLVMVLLVLMSWLVTRGLGRANAPSRAVEIALLMLAGLLVVFGAVLAGVSLYGLLADRWQLLGMLTVGCGVVLGGLVALAWAMTRRTTTTAIISPGQNLLEVLVSGMRDQIREVSQQQPERYLPFVGTLFVFIVTSNLLAIVPGFHAPTASLSTTAALAICVLVAVPFFGIANQGLLGYLKLYVQPTPLMLPFNVIGELSRTLALAVRLFGNMMSGAKIGAILLAIAPLFFPILMNALGLLTGLIQAYIFAILALVYIASANQAHNPQPQKEHTHG